jgi:hypothetical protein
VTTEKPLASRYIYDVPQRAPWSREQTRAELMDDLRERPPDIIVVERGDAVPQVTGTPLDSRSELQTFAELRTLLADRYIAGLDVPKFHVFRRVR